MNANIRRLLRAWSGVVLAMVVVGALPGAAIAGQGASPAQPQTQTRKVYYIFTTGSHIPVPYDRVSGHIATTAAHEQVIRITNRNRLQQPEFWYAGHH